MTSKIEIVRRAASRTGNGYIASLDENDDVAQIVEDHYDEIVETLLTQHAWKFARRSAQISKLADEVEPPWSALWQPPNGMLALQYLVDDFGVTVSGYEERDLANGSAIAVLDDYATIHAVYTYRVPEDRWPADFANVVQLRLEAAMLAGISEQRDQADKRERRADDVEQKARVRDQRSSSATDAAEWDLTRARRRDRSWVSRRA